MTFVGGSSPRRLSAFGRLERRPALLSVAVVCLVFGGCSSPAAVAAPALEVVVASGDGQYGTVNQDLSNPLRVVVRSVTGQVPQVGTPVSWEVLEGDASIIGSSATATDTTGSAEIRLRLGASTGAVVVGATAMGRNSPSASFEAFTVNPPALTSVVPASAAPGESITVSGSNFSPTPDENIVLFSGVRGRVTAATSSSLTVEVPACLPERSVEIRAQLGVVASGALPFAVTEPGALTSLSVAEHLDVDDAGGFTCIGLPGGGEYLTIVYSASTIGAAKHPYVLTGLSGTATIPVLDVAGEGMGAGLEGLVAPDQVAGSAVYDPGDEQRAFDRALRDREAEVVRAAPRHAPAQGAPLLAPAAAPPQVGSRRTFDVYSGTGRFTQVTAEARWVGDHAALFVDDDAPAGGFTADMLEELSDRFDDAIHPRVTSLFGAESDLDDNQRVVILFTPVVNGLTPRGSSGFVAGFFYGVDLLPEQEGSNAGEVFYALVPDPSGTYSDPRPAEAVFDVTPAVLAHEFQHMVHFNQRIVRSRAETAEALWLSEGLAQHAEEAVARRYEELGDDPSVELFRAGARTRARRYLVRPDTVSLIISMGEGSLEERGAGFLYVLYLADQFGNDLLGRLTRSTRTGVSNIEVETGREWADLLVDWWSALPLDGAGPFAEPLTYPAVDLRAFLGNPFPLSPVELGGGDFGPSDSLWSASAAYYIVAPSPSGSTTIRLGGEDGAPSAPQAGLRMRVIRIS